MLLSIISLTALFIYGELTYDNFENKDRIYRMINSFTFGSEPAYSLHTEITKPADLKVEYPEIESFVNMFFVQDMDIKNADKGLTQNVIFFDGDFLNVFTPDFIYGNITSFNQPGNICIISKSFSESLFGKNNPIGESLLLTNDKDTMQVIVAGVIDDFQNTTCMLGEVIVKCAAGFNFYGDVSDLTFLLLNENSKIDKLNNIQDSAYKNNGVDSQEGFFFQSMNEVYLKSGFLNFNFYPSGNLKLLILLILVLLLMLCCIVFNYNFMFIVLLKARIKEFSLKRIVGLEKRKILYANIADSVLFVLITGFLAYVISRWAFNSIESLNVVLNSYYKWFKEIFIVTFVTILIITIAVSFICYKSIIKFKRLDRLKISNAPKKNGLFGIGFLGTQIVVAFVLLAFAFIVKSQLEYAVNKDHGIENRDLIIIANDLSANEFCLFEDELNKTSLISGVTRIGKLPPTNLPQAMTQIKCMDGEKVLSAMLYVDKNTLETIGVKHTQGEGFQNYSDCNSLCVVSKSLADQLDVDNIIGYEVKPGITINGVINDISMVPVRRENFPLIVLCKPELCKEILVTAKTENGSSLKYISNVFESIHGKAPQLKFYKEQLKSLYKEDNFMLKYIVLFSTFTLFATFLGFYFYSIAIIDMRSKEVVIRKIHGASFHHITKLLMKEYLIVYMISIIISFLLFSYVANIWLSKFVLHIDKSLKFYIFPAFLIMVILLIAVLNSVLILARKNIVTTINNSR